MLQTAKAAQQRPLECLTISWNYARKSEQAKLRFCRRMYICNFSSLLKEPTLLKEHCSFKRFVSGCLEGGFQQQTDTLVYLARPQNIRSRDYYTNIVG